jgi:hypothetical protein
VHYASVAIINASTPAIRVPVDASVNVTRRAQRSEKRRTALSTSLALSVPQDPPSR